MTTAIEVRIPTILRPYTKEQKVVAASGETLSAVIADLDVQYPGISERLLENGALRRFINLYVNDEDVRFLGSLEAIHLLLGCPVYLRRPMFAYGRRWKIEIRLVRLRIALQLQ